MEAFKASMSPDLIDVRNIRTRAHDQRLLKIKRVKNPAYRNSLEFRTAIKWNSLHKDTRKIDDLASFTTWLDCFFDKKLEAYPTR